MSARMEASTTVPSADIALRRLCPVCTTVYFRIGVRVWEGRILRACSKRCRYLVKREVVAAVARNGRSPEQARRRIAWKYIEKGGQA